MPRVILDGTPIKSAYEPPPVPQRRPDQSSLSEAFARTLSEAIIAGFRSAIASLPPPVVNVEAPVVNIPKPEVKINSPVYVQPPEIRIPAATVNVPEGKAPIVNIEPPAVTLQTSRPTKWHFTFHRDEYGRMTSADVEAR